MTEQVRIDIVATDDASKKLDKVADKADAVEKLDPEVTVDADTGPAERGLRDVADAADKLDGEKVDVVATVTDAASAALADILGDLDKVRAQAKVTDDALDDVGRKASSPGGGPRLAGNAMSDLTGPLGDASSAAGDFGGVFDGLSDVAEKVAGKLGLSESAVGQLTNALGLAGFAVAGASVLYGLWNQRQQQAAQRAKELVDAQRKVNDELEKGNHAAAAQTLVDNYKSAFDAAEKLGISAGTLTLFLSGQTDVATELANAHKNMTAGLDEHSIALTVAESNYRVWSGTVLDAKDAVDASNGSIKTQDDRLAGATRALDRAGSAADTTASKQRKLRDNVDQTTEAYQRLRDGLNFEDAFARFEDAFWAAAVTTDQTTREQEADVRGLKGTILDLAESVKANPVQVKTTLDAVDAGDYAAVARQVQAMSALNPIKLSAILIDPATGRPRMGQAAGGGPVPQSLPPSGGGGAPVINVTQNVPRGFRGDVLVAAQAAAKRSGGLYQRRHR